MGRVTALLLAALCFGFAVAGCGDDEETVEFGEGELSIEDPGSGDNTEILASLIRQINEQSGTSEEVIDCFVGALESLPDSEVDEAVEAVEASPGDQQVAAEALLPITHKVERECVDSDTQVVDENLDENQIDVLREGFRQRLEVEFGSIPGLSEELKDCVVNRYVELPDDDLIEASNETFKEARERGEAFFRECRAELR